MNREIKELLILRICLLFCLVIFLYAFLTTPKMDCEACSFEINGEKLSAEEFFNDYYYDKCLRIERSRINGFNLSQFDELIIKEQEERGEF